jgi:ADP-heptose:LPS heptosyltransferase
MMREGRILVLQMKRIGDLILTASALRELRVRFPEAEIQLIADQRYRDLADCLPGVTRVLGYRPGGLNAAVWASVTLAPWDACLDFTGNDRSALLTALSGAARRLGYQRFSGKGWRARAYTELSLASVRDLHTVDFHHALVAHLAGEAQGGAAGDGSALQLPEELQVRVTNLQSEMAISAPFAVLHPGTARREKFWPVERWVQVAQQLHQWGLKVVITGTGSGLEQEDVRVLLETAGVPLVDLTGRLKLAELAALMQRAQVAVGVDSMAMHLAAQWQIPQVVLFGPTNPFHWRPLHEKARVLVPEQPAALRQFDPRRKGGEMEGIEVEAVVAALDEVRRSGLGADGANETH